MVLYYTRLSGQNINCINLKFDIGPWYNKAKHKSDRKRVMVIVSAEFARLWMKMTKEWKTHLEDELGTGFDGRTAGACWSCCCSISR